MRVSECTATSIEGGSLLLPANKGCSQSACGSCRQSWQSAWQWCLVCVCVCVCEVWCCRLAPQPRRLKHTVFLHVLAPSVAKHLRCKGRHGDLTQLQHHLHVLVHRVGAVLVLGTQRATLHLLKACAKPQAEREVLRVSLTEPICHITHSSTHLPTASTHSERPPSTNCLAMKRAVEPVAQLLFTLYTGTPVRPSWYTARCPQVESP